MERKYFIYMIWNFLAFKKFIKLTDNAAFFEDINIKGVHELINKIYYKKISLNYYDMNF